MFIKFVLSLFVIFLCKQAVAQERERFIVYVSEYISGNLGGAEVLCPATIITNRHVLTTAACATPSNSSTLLAIQVYTDYGNGWGIRTVGTDETFIHPNYTGDVHSSNVAVIRMGGEFNSTMFPPRTLGSIPSNNPTCNLFGWAQEDDYSLITPLVPGLCYANRPQTYCSEHVAQTQPCTSLLGSPLVCNAGSIDGFLIETGCLEESPGRFIQAYHSIGEFRDWIEIVSGAELVNRISMVTFLSALVICLKNLV